MGFDYEIHFKKGVDNVVADALSRRQVTDHDTQCSNGVNHSSMSCQAISYPYFGWLDELRRYNEEDAWIKQKRAEVTSLGSGTANGSKLAHYHLDNGLLKYKSRIVISPNSTWKLKLLTEHHSTPAAGHQGVLKTYHRLKRGFYWPDRLTKYAHFLALAHPYTAVTVAQLFVDNIFKLHGMPSTISDGQTEVVNRCVETYLRCFVGNKPKNWVKWLPWAEWNYNTSYHTSSKFTPFELVYGYPPLHVTSYELSTAKMDSVEQELIERDKLLTILRSNLAMAQNRMAVHANKKRTEREFSVGDLVYLKLLPYQLQTLASHAYHKLHPQYYGPYEVLERVGPVAYKLKLPEGTKIHPVFHVSCLKRHMGNVDSPITALPTLTDEAQMRDSHPSDAPLAIIARRIYKKEDKAGVQLLVQWVGQEESTATWEDYDDFHARFPTF
ncbi:hypothetical protein ACFX13_040051 [Malus domestica]